MWVGHISRGSVSHERILLLLYNWRISFLEQKFPPVCQRRVKLLSLVFGRTSAESVCPPNPPPASAQPSLLCWNSYSTSILHTFSLAAKCVLVLSQENILTPPSIEAMHWWTFLVVVEELTGHSLLTAGCVWWVIRVLSRQLPLSDIPTRKPSTKREGSSARSCLTSETPPFSIGKNKSQPYLPFIYHSLTSPSQRIKGGERLKKNKGSSAPAVKCSSPRRQGHPPLQAGQGDGLQTKTLPGTQQGPKEAIRTKSTGWKAPTLQAAANQQTGQSLQSLFITVGDGCQEIDWKST